MNTKIKFLIGPALATLLILPSAPVFAHHSFAMFDNSREVTLDGEVKEFQWANPHIWIQMDVKGENGKAVEWSIEGASPNNLTRQGWSSKSLKPGDQIILVMHPLKDGTAGGSFIRATVNGKPIRGSADQLPAPAN